MRNHKLTVIVALGHRALLDFRSHTQSSFPGLRRGRGSFAERHRVAENDRFAKVRAHFLYENSTKLVLHGACAQ